MNFYALPSAITANKIRLFAGPGTRQWPRFTVADKSSHMNVVSGSGFETSLVNISRGGALLRTRARIASGTTISLHFRIAEQDIPLSGFVLRSTISASNKPPRYETAVVFNRALPILDCELQPSGINSKTLPILPSGSFFGFEEACRYEIDADSARIASFLAINLFHPEDTKQMQRSELNNW